MNKHTPGPWIAFGGGMGDTRIVAAVGSRAAGKLICDCAFTHALEGAEFQANAQLIAAAPDLLDIAREAYDYLSTIVENRANLTWLAKVRDAIAKAEGRT